MVYNGLPWNRETELSAKQVYEFYTFDEMTTEKVDCTRVGPYCKSENDCDTTCGSEYSCVYHKCIKKNDPTPEIECSKDNGGIVLKTIDGDTYCYCTKSSFYIGPKCKDKNPLLKDISVNSSFDGRINDERVKYVTCDDGALRPIMIREYILCVHPDTVDSFKHMYIVDEE